MGHRFDPWSRKIPHVLEQRGPRSSTTEARVPVLCDKRNQSNKKSAQHTKGQPALATTWESLRAAVMIQCKRSKNNSIKTMKDVGPVVEVNCSGLSVW